ncbi:hypothetical protein ANN_15110 [Periplaneta americana]|uniref:Uncharacterized protein n=1 Tax=Periplaneta americana TaxID=6978 RepID=A0ABQ8SY62_PERAM|nr:hypothetical protein ANN_15110 [Periplaneta americana]
MSPGSSTESYPAFARIGLRENPGKSLNQVTCPDRDSNPGHLVSRPDALTVTPQVWTCDSCFTSRRAIVEDLSVISNYGASHSSRMINSLLKLAMKTLNQVRAFPPQAQNCSIFTKAGRPVDIVCAPLPELIVIDFVINARPLLSRKEWRRKNDAETDQEEEKELVGSLAEKKLPTEGCTGRNGEREKSSGQKKISDDRRY